MCFMDISNDVFYVRAGPLIPQVWGQLSTPRIKDLQVKKLGKQTSQFTTNTKLLLDHQRHTCR